MKVVSIIWGIIFLASAVFVIIADNVSIIGFITITNFALRYVITGLLGVLGITLLIIGIKKELLSRY